MENIKPNVIPSQNELNKAMTDLEKKKLYEVEKQKVINDIYENTVKEESSFGNAIEMMRNRTNNQMYIKNTKGVVIEENLSEIKTNKRMNSETETEKLLRLKEEQIAKNNALIKEYERKLAESLSKEKRQYNQEKLIKKEEINYDNLPLVRDVVNKSDDYDSLSTPDFNSAFDIIPIPSKGKFYKNRKPNIKVSYLTTFDENILTSPNLLKSGKFLEILFNRKILDTSIRYRDLLPQDRNTIMLWLRATAYGEMYPITVLDEFDEAFETEVNLNDLKTTYLEIDPDVDGLFTYQLPISKAIIKYKLLTCGDIDDIDELIESDKESGVLLNNGNTYTLEKMIVELNGERDRQTIRNFVMQMRLGDKNSLLKEIEKLKFGVDLNITIGTPGGGSVETFLPLNTRFFWPDNRL